MKLGLEVGFELEVELELEVLNLMVQLRHIFMTLFSSQVRVHSLSSAIKNQPNQLCRVSLGV